MQDERGIVEALVGDGRPLLVLSGIGLVLAGLFAIFQAGSGHFLPHDEHFLEMDAATLCGVYDCRIVQFMIHDRVAFGGALVAIGSLYLWLAEFPLRARQGWAWWAYLLSSVVGLASFFTYLVYSYLDTWHGVATLALLPLLSGGLWRSYHVIKPAPLGTVLREARGMRGNQPRERLGRILLLATVAGLIGAGVVIMVGGMTTVFVPQDLHYMQLQVADLHVISPRLVPLIAHDRAGFGGGLSAIAVAMGMCVWCACPSRSLWQILAVAGTSGFGCAIGIHFVVGYLNTSHLLPAYLGAVVFYIGLAMSYLDTRQGGKHLPDTRIGFTH